jgi:hypothetical protein
MAEQNRIYFQLESRAHPVVRGKYAVDTYPIEEFFEQLCVWIDSRVTGAYIYGFSRFGKSYTIEFCKPLLSEKYHGLLPIFIFNFRDHKPFSESLFLMELLGASRHKYGTSGKKKIMMDRLVRLYATCARNCGGNHIILIIDEAQNMHDPAFETLKDIQNALDSLGFKLTVISVGSHELTYQHELFILTGSIHLVSRFMVHKARFRGTRDEEELRFALRGYDSPEISEWPEGSGICYTEYFFPRAYREGFRIADSASHLWKIFLDLGPHKQNYRLEVPMEHIAKAAESVFRNYTDTQIATHGLEFDDLLAQVKASDYREHMSAISRMLKDQKGHMG